MVEQAQEYPWSSAAAHCGLKTDPLLVTRGSKLHTPNIGRILHQSKIGQIGYVSVMTKND